jgi:hypothetical protein
MSQHFLDLKGFFFEHIQATLTRTELESKMDLRIFLTLLLTLIFEIETSRYEERKGCWSIVRLGFVRKFKLNVLVMSVLMSSIGLLYLMFDLSFYQNCRLYVGDILDCFLLNNCVGIS